jgi:hypothetical protein
MTKVFCAIAALMLLASQASADTIKVSEWESLVAGDKTFTKLFNSGDISDADVQAFNLNPVFSLNLSNLGAVASNFSLDYSIEINAGTNVFDQFRVSQNDIFANSTAGTNVSVYSAAMFLPANLLWTTQSLLGTGVTPSKMFVPDLTKVWVRYESFGVDLNNRLSNISGDVTQRSPGATVPEPSSLFVYGLSALGLVLARRRMKS